MLRDEITKKLSKGFAPFLFREHLSDVAGHGIRSPCTYFPVDSSELFLRKSDRNLCSCHTGIIPLRQVPNKAILGSNPARPHAISRLCMQFLTSKKKRASCNINRIKTVDNRYQDRSI